MRQVHLQGIGIRNAVEAKELVVGDVIIYNFGYVGTVKSVELSKTGKTVKAVVENNGKLWHRQYSSSTVLAVKRVN